MGAGAPRQGGRRGARRLTLLRAPDRYIERFGREAYDIKLTDSLWFLYRLIGKLTRRLYVLRPATTMPTT